MIVICNSQCRFGFAFPAPRRIFLFRRCSLSTALQFTRVALSQIGGVLGSPVEEASFAGGRNSVHSEAVLAEPGDLIAGEHDISYERPEDASDKESGPCRNRKDRTAFAD